MMSLKPCYSCAWYAAVCLALNAFVSYVPCAFINTLPFYDLRQ